VRHGIESEHNGRKQLFVVVSLDEGGFAAIELSGLDDKVSTIAFRVLSVDCIWSDLSSTWLTERIAILDHVYSPYRRDVESPASFGENI
jgi:hypothetical protein